RDKYALLVDITDGHMTRLQALVDEVQSMGLPPEPRLRMLIERFVQEFPEADVESLRRLAAAAREERAAERPPRRYRELFQAINAILQTRAKGEP
ncbi:MAG TPA: DUF615 domain-containing protein, partial [Usitatibacteraceae bacterium]|nr:DUF615 domain-containing protein [Usitatibacteraceae bacterium]